MAFLLRFLLLVLTGGIGLTVFQALLKETGPGAFNHHMLMGFIIFIFAIFVQAFVMFFFIGVHKLTNNILESVLAKNLPEFLNHTDVDWSQLQTKALKFNQDANLAKRKIIPWCMLMLTLGSIALFMGGAVDTGMVPTYYHSGTIYGFIAALLIGIQKQWVYLGKIHILLRKLKEVFQLPDHQM